MTRSTLGSSGGGVTVTINNTDGGSGGSVGTTATATTLTVTAPLQRTVDSSGNMTLGVALDAATLAVDSSTQTLKVATAVSGAVTAATANISSLTTRTTTLEGSVGTLQSGQTTSSAAASALGTRVTALESSSSGQGSAITTINAKLVTDEANLASTSSTTSANATAISGLQTRLTADEATLQTHTTTLTALQTRATNDETSASTTAAALGSLTTQVTSNTSAISTLQTSSSSQATTLTAQQTSVTSLQNTVSSNSSSIASLTSSTSTNSANITSLQSTVGQHTTQIAQNTTDIATANSVNATQTGNISSLQTTVGQNSTAITTIQTKQTADETAITTIQTKQTADEANIAQLQSTSTVKAVTTVVGASDETRSGLARMWPDGVNWNYQTQTPANSGIYINTVSGYPALNGTYVTTQSSIFAGTPSGYSYPSSFAFQQQYAGYSGVNIEPWYSARTYTASTGAYAGTVSTTVGSGTITGEWVQMQLPAALSLALYTVKLNPYIGSTPAGLAAPASWTVVGSTDGTTWTVVDTQTVTWSALQNEVQKLMPPPRTPAYTYFRLICTAATVGQTGVGLFWNLFSLKPFTTEVWTLNTPIANITTLGQYIYNFWNNAAVTATIMTSATFTYHGKFLSVSGVVSFAPPTASNYYILTVYVTNASANTNTVLFTSGPQFANNTSIPMVFPVTIASDLVAAGQPSGSVLAMNVSVTQGSSVSAAAAAGGQSANFTNTSSLTLVGFELNR